MSDPSADMVAAQICSLDLQPQSKERSSSNLNTVEITYRSYAGESDLPDIMNLVQYELSEPYVIYTYRYFLHEWYACSVSFSLALTDRYMHRPHLCFLVSDHS